jgi:branched-chain amino acid transport system substrate-binding protein
MSPTSIKKRPPPIVFIIVGAIFVAFLHAFLSNLHKIGVPLQNRSVQDRMSFGEKLLIIADATPSKKSAVHAYGRADYNQAIASFSQSLKQSPNDPESLIGLGNALAGNSPSLSIAVSIPISSNLNVAQEILRGVAQVQQEVNRKGGINGVFLKVKIIDDQNDPEIAKVIAIELVKDDQILAVVGHNASDATLAAAPIYQQGGLVMVSPTSMVSSLSGMGSNLFRTVPSTRFVADPLAQYVVKTARKSHIAVCFDAQSKDNVSFKDEFIAALATQGGTFVETGCNFASPTFNAETAVSQAVRQGADGILLAPHVDRLDRAIDLAHAIKGRLVVFGSSTLYTFKVLQSGAQDVNSLVLPVPWHPSLSQGSPILSNARQLWGGEINWRTATAFDAAQAIVTGLRRSSDRKGLQRVLRSSDFVAQGIMGDIRFLPTGDRVSNPVLIQIQPDAKSSAGYNFVLLPRQK